MHLWEIDHPYYCSLENYYSRDSSFSFDSFAEFLAEWGDADKDLNLLFRWDWIPANSETETDVLELFFMGQRKGLFIGVEVKVKRADEDLVKAYLKPRKDHLLLLWEPL